MGCNKSKNVKEEKQNEKNLQGLSEKKDAPLNQPPA